MRAQGARMNLSQSLQTASLTDPGRVRDHNEDCIESRPTIGLYVLADGMGGYNAGEVASGMATSLIADGLEEAWTPREVSRLGRDEAKALSERLIKEQIARANSAIFTTSQNNPECAGMGTTLVMKQSASSVEISRGIGTFACVTAPTQATAPPGAPR